MSALRFCLQFFVFASGYVRGRQLLSKGSWEWKDASTPGRLASSASALLVTQMLFFSLHVAALKHTLFFFLIDSVYLLRESKIDMLLHHAVGGFLCAYSLWCNLLTEGHAWRDITLALVWMEATNPLLHWAIILKTERDRFALPMPLFEGAVKLLLILCWVKLRIVDVATACVVAIGGYDGDNITFASTFAGACVVLMLVLQCVWLCKLIAATAKSIYSGSRRSDKDS